jgi:serine/threonine-protein kinase
VRLARQRATALDCAHQQGLVHADVRPENVIVDQRGERATLVDFSLSFVSARTGSVDRTSLVRRAAYLAPEQVQGQAVDARTDVYGLGVLLYEMIVGRPPFVGATPVETAERRVYQQARPASVFEPTVPAALEAIIERALQRAPEARWRSIEALEAALAKLEADTLKPRVIETQSAEPARRRSGQGNWSRLGLIVPLVGAALALWLALGALNPLIRHTSGSASPPAQVGVPGLTGKSLPEARALLEKDGLSLSIAEQRLTDRFARDIILEQTPVAGWKAGRGDSVSVVVSTGVTVPDLRGRSLDNARATAAQLGWKIARIDRGSFAGSPAGTVVMQHPAPGEQANGPGEIALAVAE